MNDIKGPIAAMQDAQVRLPSWAEILDLNQVNFLAVVAVNAGARKTKFLRMKSIFRISIRVYVLSWDELAHLRC